MQVKISLLKIDQNSDSHLFMHIYFDVCEADLSKKIVSSSTQNFMLKNS